jgi:hypothetical protein
MIAAATSTRPSLLVIDSVKSAMYRFDNESLKCFTFNIHPCKGLLYVDNRLEIRRKSRIDLVLDSRSRARQADTVETDSEDAFISLSYSEFAGLCHLYHSFNLSCMAHSILETSSTYESVGGCWAFLMLVRGDWAM